MTKTKGQHTDKVHWGKYTSEQKKTQELLPKPSIMDPLSPERWRGEAQGKDDWGLIMEMTFIWALFVSGTLQVQDQRGLILLWRLKNTRALRRNEHLCSSGAEGPLSEPSLYFSLWGMISKKWIHIVLCTRVQIQGSYCILLLFLSNWLLLDF